jgi:hypothetical protein
VCESACVRMRVRVSFRLGVIVRVSECDCEFEIKFVCDCISE